MLPNNRMATDNYFNNKVTWITGASSGIGEAQASSSPAEE